MMKTRRAFYPFSHSLIPVTFGNKRRVKSFFSSVYMFSQVSSKYTGIKRSESIGFHKHRRNTKDVYSVARETRTYCVNKILFRKRVNKE